ncbi:carbohydrate porin [Pantoea cypripedii]|uniref:Carbohydrate porin n=1 Tax=Pantoea cypripedii TaxID=55209 RepID=A0A1X1EVP1_PANCY|nr:carbohydrate porin [Pantoea cypripedii]MBP2198157.1 porin [Pantoea cypripedii]ORM93997.1 carbohydrate porin [Pantoea cypripedii]
MNTIRFKIRPLPVALLCALAMPAAQATDFFHQDTMTGDWGGARTDLAQHGVNLTGDYVSETAGVLSGGQSYGTRYAQQIRLGATFDLNRLFNAEHAGTIQLSINDRRGRSTSADLVGNRLPIQEVYGGEYTRLSEFSYTNTLFAPQLQYKLGWLAMGNDFGGLSILTNFMNAGFCAHPLSMSGGSGWGNYPNAHLGGELKYTFNDSWALQTAVFNVNPEQNSESSRAFKPFAPGTTGYIVPIELIYNFNSALPGQYKLGYYYDSSNVARIDQPDRRADKRWGAYLLADQTIWQSASSRSQNLHVFGQATTTDEATSPFRHWYSAGLVLNGPFESRPNDAIAIGYGRAVYNQHSRDNAVDSLRAKGELADAAMVSGLDIGEQLVEMTYTLQATPWLSVRPSVQYIKEPGAFSNKEIKDTWVAGVQVKVKF